MANELFSDEGMEGGSEQGFEHRAGERVSRDLARQTFMMPDLRACLESSLYLAEAQDAGWVGASLGGARAHVARA